MIRVLVVEDDPMLLELNRRFVDKIDGFSVEDVASNGEEAIKSLKNKKIDLVILDIYMPKMDGMEVFRKVRKQNKVIDFILVTAANDTDKIEEALKLGAVDYLVKPFEFERLNQSLLHYKARKKLLIKKPFVSQEEIDQLFMGEYKEKEEKELQKGLHKFTLNRVKGFLNENKEALLSSENISEKLAMSKVTIRRYLDYLESIGDIQKKIEYGTRGRPSYRYKYIDKNKKS
ncbi:response regulator [Marinisporobacter balticus]|uniref:Transcriptional regulatory protein n=1 Tax=Marinisporobacter balticus TaxID=2018667 RepID=A0A4R2KG94_9FIRM|nr:response regulator [Marinisporobacter balticus]TCO68988.1 two-component system CitB family response regulator/CitB family two-component system response regulator MalR/two-component system response regulator DctR [Marinisporobacter balticus]